MRQISLLGRIQRSAGVNRSEPAREARARNERVALLLRPVPVSHLADSTQHYSASEVGVSTSGPRSVTSTWFSSFTPSPPRRDPT